MSHDTSLSHRELVRYARQTSLPEVGVAGQQKLKNAKVLLVGAGGLGGPIALYLTAAGVGTITIVDFDHIELTNLHRQIMYSPDEIGQSKAHTAADKLRQQNPDIEINVVEERLDKDNALELVKQHDVVVDGTDNFATRYLINDACVAANKPCVFGSIYRFEGMVTVFNLDGGPCYRCLYPDAPPADVAPSCAEGGVLGILPGVIGLLQATEVIKILLEKGEALRGRMLTFNALEMTFDSFEFGQDEHCQACQNDNPETWYAEQTEPQVVCSLSQDDEDIDLTVAQMARLQAKHNVTLVDVRSQQERQYLHIDDDLWLPLAEITEQLHSLLDNDGAIVFYCQSGMRSRQAAMMLKEHGFEQAYSLTGGVLAWHAAA